MQSFAGYRLLAARPRHDPREPAPPKLGSAAASNLDSLAMASCLCRGSTLANARAEQRFHQQKQECNTERPAKSVNPAGPNKLVALALSVVRYRRPDLVNAVPNHSKCLI